MNLEARVSFSATVPPCWMSSPLVDRLLQPDPAGKGRPKPSFSTATDWTLRHGSPSRVEGTSALLCHSPIVAGNLRYTGRCCLSTYRRLRPFACRLLEKILGAQVQGAVSDRFTLLQAMKKSLRAEIPRSALEAFSPLLASSICPCCCHEDSLILRDAIPPVSLTGSVPGQAIEQLHLT